VIGEAEATATMHAGSLRSGSRYLIVEPAQWNGVLLLFSHPVPVRPGEPPWGPDEPLIKHLVSHGCAVAGSANSIFWPLELAFSDQPALLDVAERMLGPAKHTIACGLSIGGIITAAFVQRYPDRLSGALPMCGNLAGAVAVHNRELDMAFATKTLLAPESTLKLTNIIDSQANFAAATELLHEAQSSPAGRARLAFVAAVGNIPGWHDPTSPEPAVDDFEARQRNQFALFDEVGFLVFFLARKQVEMQAGGNPSWNIDVDYRALLATSINYDQVEALYADAQLDLDEDLERLASAPRIEADPAAVAYLERHIVFDGELGGVPVLTMHTDGDGLVTPDNARAYGEVVRHAGNERLLRQLVVHSGGHCTFTFAEVLTALDVLIDRIESGTWSGLESAELNAAATGLGPGSNALLMGGEPTASRFINFEPPPFPRRYDVRDRPTG
jgi:pimeloyl-ACP methyl ester carboxylesterase